MNIQFQFDSTLKLLGNNFQTIELTECLTAMQVGEVYFHTMELDSEQFNKVYNSRLDYAQWAGFQLMHDQLKAMLTAYSKGPCNNITITTVTTSIQTYILFSNVPANELYGIVLSHNNTKTTKEDIEHNKEKGVPIYNCAFNNGIMIPVEKRTNYIS